MILVKNDTLLTAFGGLLVLCVTSWTLIITLIMPVCSTWTAGKETRFLAVRTWGFHWCRVYS